MVKVGDRIKVGSWEVPVHIKRIYHIDAYGNEVFEFEAVSTVLELDWKEHGVSKVFLHDENKSWAKYQYLN